MALLGVEDVEKNERLKKEVYEECAECAKEYLSSEQMQKFEEAFFTAAEGYIFGERKE